MTDKDRKFIENAMAYPGLGARKALLEYIDNMVESGVYRGHTKGFRKGYAAGKFEEMIKWAKATGH